MSEIVKHETALSIGQNKIANNDFFKELTELLEDDKFKNFYDKYMSNWLDIKCSITYMHLYKQFKIKYKEFSSNYKKWHVLYILVIIAFFILLYFYWIPISKILRYLFNILTLMSRKYINKKNIITVWLVLLILVHILLFKYT